MKKIKNERIIPSEVKNQVVGRQDVYAQEVVFQRDRRWKTGKLFKSQEK